LLNPRSNSSSPWKTIAIVFGSIMGFFCLASVVIGILFALGLGATIMGIWNNLVTPALNYYPPTIEPFQVPTVAIQVPNLNPSTPQPTPEPIAGEWTIYDMTLYGFRMELPDGWLVTKTNEINDTGQYSLCNLGHDLSDYVLTSPNMDEVTIRFLCGPRGGETYCPPNLVMLDEARGIYRTFYEDSDEYDYGWMQTNSDGSKACGDGWPIDNVNMIAKYRNPSGVYDLEIVDKIIQSVQKK
jgi:hypothetical protein